MNTKTNSDKLELQYKKIKGIMLAWDKEKSLVLKGKGTRDWTLKEQKELINTNKVKGYEGHHMKSSNKYPEHADNPNNIQFLKKNVHREKVHKNNFHKPTNGYYNEKTNKMEPFKEKELVPPKTIKLSKTLAQNKAMEMKNQMSRLNSF